MSKSAEENILDQLFAELKKCAEKKGYKLTHETKPGYLKYELYKQGEVILISDEKGQNFFELLSILKPKLSAIDKFMIQLSEFAV